MCHYVPATSLKVSGQCDRVRWTQIKELGRHCTFLLGHSYGHTSFASDHHVSLCSHTAGHSTQGLSHSESPKVSNLMFQLCSKLYYASDYKLPWLMKVHSLLDSLGLSYIWSNQIHTIESFKRIVKQRLMDQFIQEWQSRVAENSVCSDYRLFKKKFCFEKYLTYLPSILRQRVLKFRLSNHRLPIQQRRSLGIPRDERICTVCDSGEGRR